MWEKYFLNIPRILIYRTFHKILFRSIFSEIINFGPETQGLTDKDARKLYKSLFESIYLCFIALAAKMKHVTVFIKILDWFMPDGLFDIGRHFWKFDFSYFLENAGRTFQTWESRPDKNLNLEKDESKRDGNISIQGLLPILTPSVTYTGLDQIYTR